jgi:serine/threonine-protein kinase
MAQKESLGTIRDYVLFDEIGRGAHGTVYRAQSREEPASLVALKVIEDNSSLDRLLVEPQLLSKLRHPNIVSLRDYFLYGGKVVIVTELIDGPDLASYVEQRGAFSPAEVREFLRQMADAVAHAHAKGIFHSDLKPKNILVDTTAATPRYVLVDFGVSRITNVHQITKYVAGTCSFMAPEQLRGRGTLQSDLWALGTLAYMLLTGNLPFPGRTMEELRRQILYDEPVFPPNLAHGDATLERVIVHLLEKSIVDRTQSAEDLETELAGSPGCKAAGAEPPLTAAEVPLWEKRLQDEVQRRKRGIVLWALIAALPEIFTVVLSCVGALVIYNGQLRKRPLFTCLGFGVLAAAIVYQLVFDTITTALIGEDVANAVSIISLLMGYFALPAAAHFVNLRRAQRELTLLQSLRTSDRGQALAVLRQYVSGAPGDMNIRRRYLEALLASGQTAEAAVEARLILEVDPYNLPATLLLAHAYLELGLLERCEQVCNGYLEVAGQCFEFEELRETITRRKEAA